MVLVRPPITNTVDGLKADKCCISCIRAQLLDTNALRRRIDSGARSCARGAGRTRLEGALRQPWRCNTWPFSRGWRLAARAVHGRRVARRRVGQRCRCGSPGGTWQPHRGNRSVCHRGTKGCWMLHSLLSAPLASTTCGCLGRRRVRASKGRPHVQRARAPGRMRLSSLTDTSPPVDVLLFTLYTRSMWTKNDARQSYAVDDSQRREIALALHFRPLHPHLPFVSPESFHCGARPPSPLLTRPPRTPSDPIASISTSDPIVSSSTHEMTTDAGVSDGVPDARDVVT